MPLYYCCCCFHSPPRHQIPNGGVGRTGGSPQGDRNIAMHDTRVRLGGSARSTGLLGSSTCVLVSIAFLCLILFSRSNKLRYWVTNCKRAWMRWPYNMLPDQWDGSFGVFDAKNRTFGISFEIRSWGAGRAPNQSRKDTSTAVPARAIESYLWPVFLRTMGLTALTPADRSSGA